MSPSDAGALIVTIIRTRTLATRWPEATQALLALASYALAEFGPKPDTFAAMPAPTDAELKECRAPIEGLQDDAGNYGAEADAKAIDPVTLAIFVEIALKLITALLNRKKD